MKSDIIGKDAEEADYGNKEYQAKVGLLVIQHAINLAATRGKGTHQIDVVIHFTITNRQ